MIVVEVELAVGLRSRAEEQMLVVVGLDEDADTVVEGAAGTAEIEAVERDVVACAVGAADCIWGDWAHKRSHSEEEAE